MSLDSIQSNPLDQLYVRTWLRTLSNHSEAKPEAVMEIVSQDLSSLGLSNSAITSLKRNLDVTKAIATHGAVINPYYLAERTGKNLFCFLVDARGARYHALQTMLSAVGGDISYFGLYGPQDSLIVLYGTRQEANRLLDMLEKSRFDPSFLEILETPRFYRYDINHAVRKFDGSIRVSPETINTLVDDYASPKISQDLKQHLIENNIILGDAIIESLPHTGRLKAFVGINFIGRVPVRVTNDFAGFLLGLDQLIEESINSIFRCDGIPYDYLLSLVCDSPTKLDKVTDILNVEFGGASGIETSTFIVAVAKEQLPEYKVEETLELDLSVELREDNAEMLRQIELDHIVTLSANLKSSYVELRHEDRLFLLQALKDFSTNRLSEHSFSAHIQENITDEFVSSYLRGYLGPSISKMSSAAMIVSKFVEIASRLALKELLSLRFPIHKLTQAQNALKLQGSKIDKFTLGQVWDAFIKINKDATFRQIGVVLDEMILEEFQAFNRFRNRAAHGSLDELLHDNFQLGAQQIRNMYLIAYWILKQLQTIAFETNHLPNALQVAMIQIEHSEIDQDLYESLSSLIIDSRDQVLNRMNELEIKDRKRLHAVLVQVNSLDTSVQSKGKAVQKLVNIVSQNKKDIIENSNTSEKSKVQSAVNTLIDQGKELPANVLANLIAAILASTSQPYLSELLSMLLRGLR